MRQTTRSLLGLSVLLLPFQQAMAEPAFARLYKAQFGYTPSCNACHVDGGGSPLNSYGKAFNHANHNAASFTLIAAQDADADGFSNAEEASAKAHPGDPASTPEKPGNWLSLENLIPKAVQQAFPGVKSYKPLDAIFTDEDIAQAAGMGVDLAKSDETVIYLPVAEGKPVGMAIIVPLENEAAGKAPHYLLVTTTRKLEVDQVIGIKHDVGDTSRFSGQFAPKIEANDALSRAVKKAGAMIYVRLKR